MYELGLRPGYVLVAMQTKLKSMTDHFLDLRSIHVVGASGRSLNAMMPYGDLQIVGATDIPQSHCASPNSTPRNRTGIAKAVVAGNRVKRRNDNASVTKFKKLKTAPSVNRYRQINVLVE